MKGYRIQLSAMSTEMAETPIMHPSLWREAMAVLWVHRIGGWWRAKPFLPRPSRTHLAWRISTAYGDSDALLGGRDVTAYLDWRRRYRRAVA